MPETIEAEVIEIDGKKPVEPQPEQGGGEAGDFQRRFKKVAVTLDRRWWPLWTLLGIILVALLLTVGVVFGALYLVFALIRGIVRAFASALGFGSS